MDKTIIPGRAIPIVRVKMYSHPERLIAHFNAIGKPYFIKKSKFMTVIITGNTQFMYPDKDGAFDAKQLWVFSSVRQAAIKFLKKYPKFKPKLQWPTNDINYDYDASFGTLTGTDIVGAYWRIAYNMGVINKKLYEKCAGREFKVVRLSALSVLGRAKTYDEFVDGKKTHTTMVYPEQKELKDIYRTIRYTCFEHMQKLKTLLGPDFDSYRTDAIYYRDTPDNRALVQNYLTKHGFEFTQLIYKNKENKNE